MSTTAKIPDSFAVIAEQQGLQRALAQFPDIVAAAAERGLRPLSEAPGHSPLIAPAPVFDPTTFEVAPSGAAPMSDLALSLAGGRPRG